MIWSSTKFELIKTFTPGDFENIQMTSRKLCRVKGIKPEVIQKLAKNRITTCKDLLSQNYPELLRITGRNYAELQEIVKAASKATAPNPCTAFELYQRHSVQPGFFPTSLQELDKALRGGLVCGTVTELTGPAGCGKTQFCIMLSILATLPVDKGGLCGNVIYIDTEAAFSATRLLEMASARFPAVFSTNKSLTTLAEKIHVFVETTCISLWNRLKNLEEVIISKNVKLIILDSIASVVRKEFDGRLSYNLKERTSLLSKEAAILKYLGKEFEIPVVVTNQITTRFGTSPTADSSSLLDVDGFDVEGDEEVGGHVTAALGNTWSHAVNTRLILQYLDHQYRQVIVSKSPLATFHVFRYIIKDEGIVLEPTNDQQEDNSERGVNPSTKPIQVRSVLTPLYTAY